MDYSHLFKPKEAELIHSLIKQIQKLLKKGGYPDCTASFKYDKCCWFFMINKPLVIFFSIKIVKPTPISFHKRTTQCSFFNSKILIYRRHRIRLTLRELYACWTRVSSLLQKKKNENNPIVGASFCVYRECRGKAYHNAAWIIQQGN